MPRMIVQETVNAPVNATFAAFSDFRNAASNIKAIKRLELLTEGPIGKGTRFRETREMFGREATETMEITDWNPHGATPSYSVGGESCGARFDSTFRFHPENGGKATRVEFEMNTKALSLFAKLMWPMAFLMKGMMKKCFLADIDDMKRVVEKAA